MNKRFTLYCDGSDITQWWPHYVYDYPVWYKKEGISWKVIEVFVETPGRNNDGNSFIKKWKSRIRPGGPTYFYQVK